MTKHYIYEIFGKKIGATNDVKRRMREQGIKEGEYRVIEEHTNAKTTSIREMELQKQYGYRVDNLPYWKSLQNQRKSTTKEARTKASANTDYKAIVAKIDYKASRAKINWKSSRDKAVANTDYSKIDYKSSRNKAVANTDYKAARAKGAANTDYKTKVANTDYKAMVLNTDYKARSKKLFKPINQYSLEGTFIKKWDSATDASKELNLYKSGICACLKGKLKTAGKFIWEYAN